MNNYKENHIQLFNQYKDSCDSEIIEYLRTEGKHQFIDFVNARNNELNSYPNLSEHKDILTSYNNSYSRLFSDIVMIYHYADKYSIDNSYEDNGAYLNAFNLRQINIKKLLKNIRDKSFVINHYLLQNKRATAIYYQEYCLRAFDLFIDCLNDFEIKIQLSPLNELFERTKQVLVDSINIERIKITQEIEKSKSKEIVNEKKNPFPKIFNCEDDKAYNLFKDFANEIVTDYYLDYSFIFHINIFL